LAADDLFGRLFCCGVDHVAGRSRALASRGTAPRSTEASPLSIEYSTTPVGFFDGPMQNVCFVIYYYEPFVL
jgi:hypothetical protein